MNDYGRMGDGLGSVLAMVAVVLVVLLPLGLWKFVEILVWVFQHVKLSMA